MLEGHGEQAPRLYGRVSRWFDSQQGHLAVDAVVALALMAIVLAQSWAHHGAQSWAQHGLVTRWRVHGAAQLLERDLRFTRRTAISATGHRAHAELCLRAHGCTAEATLPAFVYPRARPSSTTPP